MTMTRMLIYLASAEKDASALAMDPSNGQYRGYTRIYGIDFLGYFRLGWKTIGPTENHNPPTPK